MKHRLTLTELQRIKQWHVSHRAEHPVEYHLWDTVLTLWLLGWMGFLAAVALDDPWATPLCLLGTCVPNLYVNWRAKAHQSHRMRCDWLGPLA